MASYIDEYKALDTVPQQKASLYQYLSDNRSSLGMTPDEEYKFNWGQDALSEDWMNTKAQQIQKNVEAANSTSILRRGLGKDEVAKTQDEEVAAKEAEAATATDAKNPIEVNGSGGDGPTFGGGAPSTTTSFSTGFNSDAAKSAAKYGAPLGPLGIALGYVGGGVLGGMHTTTTPEYNAYESSKMDSAAARMAADDQNAFDQSIRDMEAGYSTGSDGGIGGDNGRDHGNSGSAPGGGA